MAKVITFGNFKGGVGKTTASCMLSYSLHRQGYKVLLLDFDPQANATGFLTTSYKVTLADDFISIYQALEQGNLQNAILHLDSGFDLIPSGGDLVDFNNLVIKNTKGQQADMEHFYLAALLNNVQSNYDFVIIDTPPTISEFTNNALLASDYTLIVMQTEPDSLLGAINYHRYIQQINAMVYEFNKRNKTNIDNVKTLGVLPYLEKKKSRIDQYTLNKSLSDDVAIKDLILQSHVYKRERVKRFRINGIKNKDRHDKEVLKMYDAVTAEILERMID